MNFDFKNRKNQITAGVIAVLVIFAGWYFLGRSNQPEASVNVTQDPVEAIIGRDLLSSLDKMKSVKLDTSFFNDPVYKSLQDTSVQVPKQPIGRRDPFAPIGNN